MGVVDGNIQEEIRCYVMRSMNVDQSTFSPVHSVLVAPSTKGTLTVTLLPSTGNTCLSVTSGDWVIVFSLVTCSYLHTCSNAVKVTQNLFIVFVTFHKF